MIPKLTDQPVAYSAAFKAVLAALVLLGVVTFTGEQVAGLSVAFDALLTCLVWPNVTPTKRAQEAANVAATVARHEALSDVASLKEEPPAPARRAAKKAAPAKR